MKPPKVIYLQVCGECNDHDCDKCKFEDLAGISWCQDKVYEKDVAYFSEEAVRDMLVKAYVYAQRLNGDSESNAVKAANKLADRDLKKLKGGEK